MQYIVYWGPQRPGSGWGPNHLAPALRTTLWFWFRVTPRRIADYPQKIIYAQFGNYCASVWILYSFSTLFGYAYLLLFYKVQYCFDWRKLTLAGTFTIFHLS